MSAENFHVFATTIVRVKNVNVFLSYSHLLQAMTSKIHLSIHFLKSSPFLARFNWPSLVWVAASPKKGSSQTSQVAWLFCTAAYWLDYSNYSKHAVEKSQRNASSVTMHLRKQNFLGLMWKHTVEISPTNAISVTMCLPKQTISGLIWNHPVESNECNQCDNTSSSIWDLRTHLKTMHLLKQTILGPIWNHPAQKSQTNANSVTIRLLKQGIWGLMWKMKWRKVKQMQPVWLCIFLSRGFEDSYENMQWRKIKQMQPVWL